MDSPILSTAHDDVDKKQPSKTGTHNPSHLFINITSLAPQMVRNRRLMDGESTRGSTGTIRDNYGAVIRAVKGRTGARGISIELSSTGLLGSHLAAPNILCLFRMLEDFGDDSNWTRTTWRRHRRLMSPTSRPCSLGLLGLISWRKTCARDSRLTAWGTLELEYFNAPVNCTAG